MIVSKTVDRGANPRDCASQQPVKLCQHVTKISADVFTPVAVYLRLRDRFPGCVLLESGDARSGKEYFSFIAAKPVAEILLKNNQLQTRFNGRAEQTILSDGKNLAADVDYFFSQISFDQKPEQPRAASFFGYTGYSTVSLLEKNIKTESGDFPLLRYRFYRYVLVFDHQRDELYCCEHSEDGASPETEEIIRIIQNKDIPVFPFALNSEEKQDMTDDDFLGMAENAKEHCRRGDVFQLVFSRKFMQPFTGDDFNVYRSLRAINPSPYLFYFDFTDYRIFGSSPESQLIAENGKAVLHPIAGTFRRTGNETEDKILAEALFNDAKENAEHVMLVDLARNDLSRFSGNVNVTRFREVHYYSHVLHLVSEVCGEISSANSPFQMLTSVFPAGTLTGAPKYRAMQLISRYEKSERNWYGGAIGMIGVDGTVHHAILIRSFFSKDNILQYRAGAGITVQSDSSSELREISNKLGAVRQAIADAANH